MRSNVLRKLARHLALVASATALAGCYSMNGYVVNSSGQSYYQQGNYQAAASEFQQALLNDPTNADYMANLAKARWKLGDSAGAEQLYRQALTVSPSHQPAYHGMAELMLTQGRSQEAAGLLQTWAATQPYVAESHVELAWLQQQMGQQDAAAQSLQHALQVSPGHPTALAHLGQYYQDAGRPDQAVAMYQQSLQADWNQPEVHSRMALAAHSAGANHPMASTAMARGMHPYGIPRQQTVLGPPSPGQQMAHMQQQMQLAQGYPGTQQTFMPPFAMASPVQTPSAMMQAAVPPASQTMSAPPQVFASTPSAGTQLPVGHMPTGHAPVGQMPMGQMPLGQMSAGQVIAGTSPSVSSVIQSDPLLQQGWSVVPGSIKVTEGGGGGGSATAVTSNHPSAPAPQPDPGFSQATQSTPARSISSTSPLQSGNGITAAADVPVIEAF